MVHERGGFEAPEQLPEIVNDPKEAYGNLETMFLVEHLREHLDEVRGQLENLRRLIVDYQQEEYDRGEADVSSDRANEISEEIERVLQNFTLNHKRIDVSVLTKRIHKVDIFNELADRVNYFIEHRINKLGGRERHIELMVGAPLEP